MKSPGKKDFKLYHDRKCMVCGAQTPGIHIGEVAEHEYENTTDLVFSVFQCPDCSLVYLYPRPDSSELSVIYPHDYYSYHMTFNAPEGGARKSFVQSIFYRINAARFRKRFSRWWKGRNLDRPLRVLDVGCGVGAQLDIFKGMFPDCETYGIEINEVAVRKAKLRGHEVYYGLFEEVNLPTNFFDVVSSYHVIEHLGQPDDLIRKSLELINDGGVIHLETPNTTGLDFEMFKSGHWGGYHPPRHWYLFQFRTFEKLLERFNGEIIAKGYASNGVFWNWTFHSISKKLIGKRLANMAFPPITIFYGGIRAFVILSVCSVIETVLRLFLGRGNSIWILAGKSKNS